LGNPAALSQRLALVKGFNLRGITVRGLGTVSNGADYAAALQSYLGTAEAPQPTSAAIVGESLASLGTLDIAVVAPVVEATLEPTPEVVAESTPGATGVTATATVKVGANVRVGPGVAYGTIAGGLQAGTIVQLIGRDPSAVWLQILRTPPGKTPHRPHRRLRLMWPL
jgi:predicted alpha/beta hydrolase